MINSRKTGGLTEPSFILVTEFKRN